MPAYQTTLKPSFATALFAALLAAHDDPNYEYPNQKTHCETQCNPYLGSYCHAEVSDFRADIDNYQFSCCVPSKYTLYSTSRT